MSEGRCGTCRWWQREDSYGRERFGEREGNGRCGLISDVGEPDSDLAGAVEVGNSFGQGAGWLLTRAEFGCVLHEPAAEGTPQP